jgi:hypothetical protein
MTAAMYIRSNQAAVAEGARSVDDAKVVLIKVEDVLGASRESF